eukprot:3557940-Rhodomonas_salina.1
MYIHHAELWPPGNKYCCFTPSLSFRLPRPCWHPLARALCAARSGRALWSTGTRPRPRPTQTSGGPMSAAPPATPPSLPAALRPPPAPGQAARFKVRAQGVRSEFRVRVWSAGFR